MLRNTAILHDAKFYEETLTTIVKQLSICENPLSHLLGEEAKARAEVIHVLETPQAKEKKLAFWKDAAEGLAIEKLRLVVPENMTYNEKKSLGKAILLAYQTLYHAVLNGHIGAVIKGIKLIEALPITNFIKKKFLDVKVSLDLCEPEATKNFCLFAIAAYYHQLAIMQALSKAGANIYAKIKDVPVFFAMINEVIAIDNYYILFFKFTRHRLMTFDAKEKDLAVYFDHPNFNLAEQFQGQNILTFAYESYKNENLRYPVCVLLEKIKNSIDQKKIPFGSFKKFCEDTPYIKYFPSLVKRYNDLIREQNLFVCYANDHEKEYFSLYQVYYLIEAFCTYQQARMEKSQLIKIAGKEKLNSIVNLRYELDALGKQFFDKNHLSGEHTKDLDKINQPLLSIIECISEDMKMARFSIDNALIKYPEFITSELEWDSFCKTYQEELSVLRFNARSARPALP